MKALDYEIGKVGLGERGYPKLLNELKSPPAELYYRGDLGVLRRKTVAVVGSRKMSRYGREATERLVAGLVKEGVVTISGFMYGVDTEAHRRTIEYGGKTVAVFGCGLDTIYPPENEKLYGEILAGGGLVLSEYEPAAKPHLWKFPQRNRIVAVLAKLGVVVVEAGEKSGSLITAGLAREMGRQVYAVPGQITSAASRGTNGLIAAGEAKLVTGAEDLVGKTIKRKSREQELGLAGIEKRIWEELASEALSADEIAAQLGEGVVEVGMTLSMMGIKGILSESGGKFYRVEG